MVSLLLMWLSRNPGALWIFFISGVKCGDAWDNTMQCWSVKLQCTSVLCCYGYNASKRWKSDKGKKMFNYSILLKRPIFRNTSVRNKALPVVRDNQNLWQTINHEVVRSDNRLCEGYFHIYYLKAFISQVTVRVENFDYRGELPLVG